MDTNGSNHTTPRGPGRERSVWTVIGITLAVLLAIGGLAVVCFAVVFAVALTHYGSNK